MQRRRVLRGVALLVAETAGGCSTRGGEWTTFPPDTAESSEAAVPETNGTEGDGTETQTAADTETATTPEVSVSELLANHGGPDAAVEIVCGVGSSDVDGAANLTDTLFVSSDEPLLDNDGMRLTLRDATGVVVDRIDYWDVDEGRRYVRPET